MESTDMASAEHTSHIVYTVVTVVYPKAEPTFIEQLDAVLRKSGHFIGYGILGVLVVLALQRTNRDRMREILRRPWASKLHDFWRLEWAVIGILVTIVTASFDEMHQTFIASRSGRWQDVVLDTCGAIVLQVLVYLLSLRFVNRKREPIGQPEFSSMR